MSFANSLAKEVNEALAGYTEKLEGKMYDVILDGSLTIERTAKELWKGSDEPSVPGEPPRVQTGETRRSISHDIKNSNGRIESTIGPNTSWAFDLEFGTTETWPHPFMQPAFDENIVDIQAAIAEALGEVEP